MTALGQTTAIAAPEPPAAEPPAKKGDIWWSNSIFFVGMHLMALVGAFHLSPWWQLDRRTLWMCIISWQLATFGITVGYHRLWSHRAFTAAFPLRVVLAGMGCLGFQGSIKWWTMRHRLHHRFTDTESDPYNAKAGLYHSHMGWIFRKPDYPRMKLVDRKDLDADLVVRFQHRHYIPLTLTLGLVAPTLIGWSYGDALGGYIWGGVIARILIWHFTFFINSLAHYLGEQAYSEDVTARGNFFLAIFTGGEANHNYHHAFPHDYRNGPRSTDWDPTKWIIYSLHHFTPLIPVIRQTPESDILKARAHVLAVRADNAFEAEGGPPPSSFALWGDFSAGSSSSGTSDGSDLASSASSSSSATEDGERWERQQVEGLLEGAPMNSKLRKRIGRTGSRSTSWSTEQLIAIVEEMGKRTQGSRRPLVLVINGWAIDATDYAKHHPGGVAILREYAVSAKGVKDATAAFEGGLNDHGWYAREKLRELRMGQVLF